MWFQPMLGRLLLLRYNKLVGNLGVRHYKTTTYNGKMRTPSARNLVTLSLVSLLKRLRLPSLVTRLTVEYYTAAKLSC